MEQRGERPAAPASDPRIIRPSISELTREVRTNILCTVPGCAKILPNTPALNMHLVKSHRVQDGLVNPTVRKVLKGPQTLYCCPVQGCPRGPDRPFSQFSLVKQHFMKMHAEKKHKCVKCSNGYSTEWDLRRHAEDCGRTYRCTCGCPYASRAALLSHVYRTGHELPKEHRFPPGKKRKLEQRSQSAALLQRQESQEKRSAGSLSPPAAAPKLLLPKPRVALVSVPVLPVLLPAAFRPLGLTVNVQGTVSTLNILPLGAVVPPVTRPVTSHHALLGPRPSAGSSGETAGFGPPLDLGSKNKTSANIQTDMSFLQRGALPEQAVSSGAQTDISLKARLHLPVSVQTQTAPPQVRPVFSSEAQTDFFSLTRETQTADQETDARTLSVSTQTAAAGAEDHTFSEAGLFEDKVTSSMCFASQTEMTHQNPVADNQTQTLILFRDLENILSDGAAEPHPVAIDFDFEDFLNGTHIQTQTEESEFCALELLDIETQTDVLLLDRLTDGHACDLAPRVQNTDLELEMFDTQTQTDLNFLLDSSGHVPLCSILRQSSFSISTESSDTETQTDLRPAPSPSCSSAETQTGRLIHASNQTQTAVGDFQSADLPWSVESHFSSVETQTSEEHV